MDQPAPDRIRYRAWIERDQKMLPVAAMFFSGDKVKTIHVVGTVSKLYATYSKTTNVVTEGYFVLQQRLGVKAVDGLDIYEGDLLRYISSHNQFGAHEDEDYDELYQVKWLEYGFGAVWINPRTPTSSNDPVLALRGANEDMKIVGNIYANPGLLKQ